MAKKDFPEKHYVDYTHQELRRLEYWFEGFKAAGGQIPPCMKGPMNPIYKAIRLIDEHVETRKD